MQFIQIGDMAFNVANILYFEQSSNNIWVECNGKMVNVRFKSTQEATECFKRTLSELNKEDK